MRVNGSDCSIVIKTQYREMAQFGEAELRCRNATHFCTVPYTEETIREAYSLLKEEAAIEGNGVCGGIRKNCGVIGCVVMPLGIGGICQFSEMSCA